MADALSIKQSFVASLAEASGRSEEEVLSTISIPKDASLGELSSNIAFKLAKELKKSPKAIAEELSAFISIDGCAVSALNGYVNLKVEDSLLFADPRFPKKEATAIVEGPSVNPNKPWHLGHLRNALLCESISNILAEVGYAVVKMDYVNDLGLQVAQSFWYYTNKHKEREGKFDHLIGEEYVEAAKLFEDPSTEAEVRELMKKIEEGSEEHRNFVERVYKAQRQTAYAYGITHRYAVLESDVVRELMDKGVDILSSLPNVVKVSEGELAGCYAVDISGEIKGLEQPLRVLIRSDGTPTYLGKDLVFHMWKVGKLCCLGFHNFEVQPNGKPLLMTPGELPYENPENPLVVNVIGSEQSLPQEVVRVCLHKLDVLPKENYRHVAYGRVRKKEGTFSGRKGTWKGFTADELLEEGKSRVEKGDKERIALAAIKFFFLKQGSRKELVFDWDKALSLEGASGVYLLYSFVRATKILQKAGRSPAIPEGAVLNETERGLLRYVWLYPYFVEASARSLEPNIIADYLLNLSALFSSFYEKNRVIGSDAEEKRLAIVAKFKETLRRGLSLLGIEPVEEM